uniref:proton-conducting transporter transmembrane domain-containing protein n=1 Tax=Fulvivirga sp. TaxID=1931237 RepID=UPI00404B09DE
MISQNLLALIVILSPAAFAITALVSWFQPGMRPKMVKQMGMISTVISIAIALICGYLVMSYGQLQTELIGINNLGFSLRVDALSIMMMTMIALLGFIIVKFSINYLDGDKRQGAFIGRLAATIASVQLLVLSGNLGILLVSWILTSVSLHRLLVFYSDRPGALVAAKKKFILARLGDLCLLIAVVLMYNQFGTGDLESIFTTVKNNQALGLPLAGLETVAIFLVLTALLKSAQFPTHGWLIEVMETPTPVSALLHAGLLNAGPFLIIRMAFVLEASSYAPIILMIVGGFTALFGSVVYLTQTSVKTALAYSSIAHMGFSLMVCGLGVYPAAMLHLVAHSFYKAHSFLSSGSVIDVIRGSKIKSLEQAVKPYKVIIGIALAVGVYLGFAMIWGINPEKELSLLAIGAIIVLGLSRIFTAALESKKSLPLLIQATLMAILVTTAFFTLESGTHYLLSAQVPELTVPGLGKIVAISAILIVFAAVVFIQILAPFIEHNATYSALAIHIRNGFYANAIFDRTVSALRVHSPETKHVTQLQADQFKRIEYINAESFDGQPA